MKRLFALILALAIVLGILPTTHAHTIEVETKLETFSAEVVDVPETEAAGAVEEEILEQDPTELETNVPVVQVEDTMPTEEIIEIGKISTTSEPTNSVTASTTGECRWTLDGTVLTISGKGAMGNYNNTSNLSPWGKNVTEVIIENGAMPHRFSVRT